MLEVCIDENDVNDLTTSAVERKKKVEVFEAALKSQEITKAQRSGNISILFLREEAYHFVTLPQSAKTKTLPTGKILLIVEMYNLLRQ